MPSQTIFFLFLSLSFCYLFIDKLKSENSKVLDNWPSLISKLQIERDLAQENAEYLSTLQEYFIVSINQPWLFCRVLLPVLHSSIASSRYSSSCMPKGLDAWDGRIYKLHNFHPYCSVVDTCFYPNNAISNKITANMEYYELISM